VSALAFLDPAGAGEAAPARSPLERSAVAAGGRVERRGRWNVVAAFAEPRVERERMQRTVAFADRSPLRKLELHGTGAELAAASPVPLNLGVAQAAATDGAWWCLATPTRALVLGGSEPVLAAGVRAIDVTTALCAMSLIGPLAGELLARFCAIDVRDSVSPVRSFRPGSIARTPGYLLRPAGDELLILIGWAYGQYLWETVSMAAQRLGGGPVGADAVEGRDHA
jgi:glycine cleavage system aminomethyltransferase T